MVLCFLWLLQSSEAADFNGPPVNKACSDQEELENLGAYSQECRTSFEILNLTNAATVLFSRVDPVVFTVLCSDDCSERHMEHIEECYPDLVGMYGGACLFNENEEMCFTALYNSLVTDFGWQDKVRAECYVNFTDFADNTPTEDCSAACKEGLQQLNDELGCCVNSIYNNSFPGEYLPFAEYSLWSNCGLESEAPGFCTTLDGPPVNKACSDQEELENLGAYSQECRTNYDVLNLANAATVLFSPVDPVVFTVLCSDDCSERHMEHIEECYPDLVGMYGGTCLFNENEEMCFTALYNSLVTDFGWQDKVRAECYVNFTDFADNTPTEDCSAACKEGLQQFNDELGCCVNSIYNNSFPGEYLPFAEYSLWSNCGLESEAPGFCTTDRDSASALSMGIYSIFAVVTLGTVIF